MRVCTICNWTKLLCHLSLTVGEEEELPIKDAVEMIADALDFKGQIVVSFYRLCTPDRSCP